MNNEETILRKLFDQHVKEIAADLPDFDSQWREVAVMHKRRMRRRILLATAATFLLLVGIRMWSTSVSQSVQTEITLATWNEPTKILLTSSYENLGYRVQNFQTDFLIDQLYIQSLK